MHSRIKVTTNLEDYCYGYINNAYKRGIAILISSGDHLFVKYDLRSAIENQKQQLLKEIDGIDSNDLLRMNIEELTHHLTEKYIMNIPQLLEDHIQVSQEESKVDVNGDPNRMIIGRSRPVSVEGTTWTYHIPYEGDIQLFHCRASTFTMNPPIASIDANELKLSYTLTEHDIESIKAAFERDKDAINKHLDWITKDVSPVNDSIKSMAHQRIEARRSKLLKNQGIVAELGFPLRKMEGAAETYVVPTVRKKLLPVMPKASKAAYIPEPTLSMEDYEHIISVMSNMVMVMERSPQAFKNMQEEDLRQHFLVQLNGQYEGQATGETFNFEGKTDILIRAEDKNVFIAECKFWHGPKSLIEAVDQILKYTTWRDTKTAMLVFNRGGSFSSVLEQIPEVVKAHPNFIKEIEYTSETGYRFTLHHRDDPDRELILTVLAFEVPA